MVKLLVPLDRTETSESVLVLAAQAAERLQAEVHLLTVVPPARQHETFEPADHLEGGVMLPPTADTSGRVIKSALEREMAGPAGTMVETRDQALQRLRDSTSEHLQDLARHFPGRPCHTVVLLEPDPAAQIVRYASAEQVDLIAMATHARSGLGRVLVGSVTEAVIRRTSRPVLLLGPRADPAPIAPRSLILCVDGSLLSESLIPIAAFRAQALNLHVTVVQVVSPRGERAVLPPDVSEQAYVERLGKMLCERGVNAAWEVLHGAGTAATICAYAREVPGAIVALGTHSRAGLSRLALGSVAMAVVQHCARPVLVFHPRQIEAAPT